jgi:hypothetical protein
MRKQPSIILSIFCKEKPRLRLHQEGLWIRIEPGPCTISLYLFGIVARSGSRSAPIGTPA